MLDKFKNFCKNHKGEIVAGAVIATTIAITTACIIYARNESKMALVQGYNKKLCNNIQTFKLPGDPNWKEDKAWGQTAIETASNTRIGHITVDAFQTDGITKAVEMVNKWMEDNKLNLVEYITVYAQEVK